VTVRAYFATIRAPNVGSDAGTARALNRLSARRVATVAGAGYYADGGGLYLQLTATGAKS